MKAIILLIACIFLLFVGCQDEPVQNSSLYFPKVKQIIQNKCIQCHSHQGTGSPKGLPVLFETDDEIISSAPLIKSATIDPVSPQNKRMPYGSELSQEEKDIILNWFQKGGKATD